MATVTTQDGDIKTTITTQDGTRIYYKNWGEGRPVVFGQGWPLSADAWESQMVFPARNGYRTICHDRRGDRPGSRSGASRRVLAKGG